MKNVPCFKKYDDYLLVPSGGQYVRKEEMSYVGLVFSVKIDQNVMS